MFFSKTILPTQASSAQFLAALSSEVHEVSFGLYDMYKAPDDRIEKRWLGEIKTQDLTFKLFALKNQNHTSDFKIKGFISERVQGTSIITRIYPQPLILISLLGLAISSYVFVELIQTKFPEINCTLISIAASLLSASIYILFLYKDYSSSKKEIIKFIAEAHKFKY